jgi:hypothetical protein
LVMGSTWFLFSIQWFILSTLGYFDP